LDWTRKHNAGRAKNPPFKGTSTRIDGTYMGRGRSNGKQKLAARASCRFGYYLSHERDPGATFFQVSQSISARTYAAAGKTSSLLIGGTMSGTLGRGVLGLSAGALSVLIVHQSVGYLLSTYGMTRSVPWNLRPLGYGIAPWIPILLNNMVWGGLWGILFALIYRWLPTNWSWSKGLIYGVLILILSIWIFRPLILQYLFNYPPQAMFSGFNGSNPMVLLPSFLFQAGFGLGLGIIYGLIARGRA
jgi:hypothetical protein